MTSHHLPDRPNLEQLKKQAKSLLRAAQAQDPAALATLRALPALRAQVRRRARRLHLALHDAQSVIAREHGFAVLECAARGGRGAHALVRRRRSMSSSVARRTARSGRAERLLALHPGIASASAATRRWCWETPPQWRRACASIPSLRRDPGGPQDWEPLLYACHTCMHRAAPPRLDGLVAIARRLCALGANPNAEYHWNWHPELPRTALWGALCACQPPAARGGAARGRRQSNRWRHRRTSRVAAATSPRSSCCIDSACT